MAYTEIHVKIMENNDSDMEDSPPYETKSKNKGSQSKFKSRQKIAKHPNASTPIKQSKGRLKSLDSVDDDIGGSKSDLKFTLSSCQADNSSKKTGKLQTKQNIVNLLRMTTEIGDFQHETSSSHTEQIPRKQNQGQMKTVVKMSHRTLTNLQTYQQLVETAKINQANVDGESVIKLLNQTKEIQEKSQQENKSHCLKRNSSLKKSRVDDHTNDSNIEQLSHLKTLSPRKDCHTVTSIKDNNFSSSGRKIKRRGHMYYIPSSVQKLEGPDRFSDSSALTEKSWTDTTDDQKSASNVEKNKVNDHTSDLNMKKVLLRKHSDTAPVKCDDASTVKRKMKLSSHLSKMSTSGKNSSHELEQLSPLDTMSSRKECDTDATSIQCGVFSSSGRKIKRPAHWSSMSLSSGPKLNRTDYSSDNSTLTETLQKSRTDIHFDETVRNTTITSFSAKINDVTGGSSGSSDHRQLLKLFNARVRIKRLSSAEIDACTKQLTTSNQDEQKVSASHLDFQDQTKRYSENYEKDRSIFEENCPDYKIEICSNDILPEGDKQSELRPSSKFCTSKGEKKKMFTKRDKTVGQVMEINSELNTENEKSSYVQSDHCYENCVSNIISRNVNVGQKRTRPDNLKFNFHKARAEKKAKIDLKSNQLCQPMRRSNRRKTLSMKLKMAKFGDACTNDGIVSWEQVLQKAGKIGHGGSDGLVATDSSTRKETHIFEKTAQESIKSRQKQLPLDVDVELKSEHDEESASRVYQCSHCDVTFENYRHLYLHITSHHTGDKCFICFTCGLGVGCTQKHQIPLESQHKEKHKDEEFPYICTFHEKCFKYKALFQQHIENDHMNQSLFTCDICDKHISSYGLFVNHYKECFRQKYKICNRSNTYKQKIITSPNTSNENVIDKETDLLKQLFNADDLRSFGLNIDKTNSSLIDGSFHCEVCEDNFIDYTDLYAHLKVHPGSRPMICLQCGKGINGHHYKVNTWKRDHSVRHKDSTDSLTFFCNICYSRFAKAEFLVWHKRKYKGKGYFVCRGCGKDFLHGANFTNHITRKSQCYEHFKSIRYNFIDNNDVMSCTYTEENMKEERKTKHSKSLTTKTRPLSHEVQITRNQKLFLQKQRFSKLKRKFDKARELLWPARIKKMAAYSTELKSHICPNQRCNKVVKLKRGLTLHINKNHNVLNMKFACKFCGECFGYIKDLWNHTRLHHSNIRYRCKICGRRLATSRVLKLHMEKGHKCEVSSDFSRPNFPAVSTVNSTQIPLQQGEWEANEAYIQPYLLQSPVNKSFEGYFSKSTECTESEIKTENAETEETNFEAIENNKVVERDKHHITADDICICEHCGLLHESKNLLNLHIKKSHSGKEWTCKLCDKAVFTSLARVTKHCTQLHKNIFSNFLCFGAPTVKIRESSKNLTQSLEEHSKVQIVQNQSKEKAEPVSQVHTESRQYTLEDVGTQLRRNSTLPIYDDGELAKVDNETNSADTDNHVKVQLINYSSNLSEGGVYTATRLELYPVKKIKSFNSSTSTSSTISLENSQNFENDLESFVQKMSFKEDGDRMKSEDDGNIGMSADDTGEMTEMIVDNADTLETSANDDHKRAKTNDVTRHNIEKGTSNNGTEISSYDNIIKAETIADDDRNVMEINGNYYVGILENSQLRQFGSLSGKDFTQNEIDIASSLLNLDSPIRPATPVKENPLHQSKPLNVLTPIKQNLQSNMDVLVDNEIIIDTSAGCIAVEDVNEEVVVETILKALIENQVNVEANSISIEKKVDVENDGAVDASAFKPVTIDKNSYGANYSIIDSCTVQNDLQQNKNDNQNELLTNKNDIKADEEETVLVTPKDVVRRKLESAKVSRSVDVPRKLAEPYQTIINMPDNKDEVQNVVINLPKYINTVDLSVANMDTDDEDVYLLFYI